MSAEACGCALCLWRCVIGPSSARALGLALSICVAYCICPGVPGPGRVAARGPHGCAPPVARGPAEVSVTRVDESYLLTRVVLAYLRPGTVRGTAQSLATRECSRSRAALRMMRPRT